MTREWVLVALLVIASCGKAEVATPTVAPRASAELGNAAARVNHEAISTDEVQRLSEATGVAPRVALEKLVAERLLAQYAESRGYGEQAAVRRMTKQAQVQAVLADAIEGPGSPADTETRRQELDALLLQLRQQTPVRFEEAAIRQAFVDATP